MMLLAALAVTGSEPPISTPLLKVVFALPIARHRHPSVRPLAVALQVDSTPSVLVVVTTTFTSPLRSHKTFYQELREQGYWTAVTGKIDLVKPSDTRRPTPQWRHPHHACPWFLRAL